MLGTVWGSSEEKSNKLAVGPVFSSSREEEKICSEENGECFPSREKSEERYRGGD